jgi:hypothetical protein
VRVKTPVRHARLGVVRRPPTPEQPRSYIVTVNSKNYRRNRRNLLKVIEPESTGINLIGNNYFNCF